MAATSWYIARDFAKIHPASPKSVTGPSVGPLTTAKLLELASSGKLRADVLVWMDGTDVLITLEQFLTAAAREKAAGRETSAEVPPSASTKVVPPAKDALPDWLADVAHKESSELVRPASRLDWLEDVRQSENLPTSSPNQAPLGQAPLPAALQPGGQTAPSRSRPRNVADVPLDWLEDIRQIEESLHLHPPSPPAPPPVKALKMALPVPIQPLLPTNAPAPVQPAAPPGPECSGYNPETGEILDPAAYALFQKAEAQRRQDEWEKQPSVSVAEAFIEAHRVLQEWVDAAANRALVTRGDMEPIRQCPAVKELLRRYENYGPVMQERLWKRLAVLVDNRQKFHKAFGIV